MPSAFSQPRVVVVNGQSYTVAATEVVGPFTTLPLPALDGSPKVFPAPVVVGGVPVILVGTSQAIISGQTYAIGPSAQPTTVVVNGQTISVGSGGVGFVPTTLRDSDFIGTAINGVDLGIGASEVVISGTTYKIGPSASPTTIVVNGQTISIGSGGVGFASTTLQASSFATTAVDGVRLAVGASQVVISGTTYNIGPSARPTTIVVNGQTISIGSGGVGFTSTTLQGSSFTTTAVGRVTFSIGASQVVISGTTYNIGPSATPTTVVVNGETISIGPSGLGFASTTLPAIVKTGVTGPSTAQKSSSNTLPSQTGSGPPGPTSSNDAPASKPTLLRIVTPLLLASVVILVFL